MSKFQFNPQDHYKINAFSLFISVIFGLIFCLFFQSVIPLIVLPILSQVTWLKDLFVRVIHREDVNAINRLTNSAGLADKADSHTVGRYRAAPKYKIENRNGYKLLYIDPNGVSGTTKIDQLAQNIAAAYHSSAYLVKLGNGRAVYRIDTKGKRSHVDEDDF